MPHRGEERQSGAHARSSERVQIKNPIINRWVKLDTRTGRILDTKSPGPYKGVPSDKLMPLIFSPVDLSELRGPFRPRPRSAFLMLQLGGTISSSEVRIKELVARSLLARNIEAVTAAAVPGTGDYLQKIVDLIRGCGFGFAIFSDLTPARSLANIFFEVGVAGVLGKPVQLPLAGPAPPPSDFVRTEWIRYDDAHEARFETQLTDVLGKSKKARTSIERLA